MTSQSTENCGELLRYEGTLVDIPFKSPVSPWGIGVFKREDESVFCASGDFGQAILYEEYVLYGQRVPDIEGGDLEVSQFTSRPPRSVKALSGYLSSLTGVGRGTTSKLVEHFGEELVEILDRCPERLSEASAPGPDIERLASAWARTRSDRLALSKVDLEGVPLYKLSKLQRYYGNEVDLNKLIKTDPFALYIHFEDFPFSSAQALAQRLGVSNQSESAIRGAVIAALRREAWLGHSLIEGAQLGQTVVKLLRVNPEFVRPLLAPAVAELRKLGLVVVDGRRIQLTKLHHAEQTLFQLIDKWSQKEEQDLALDLVPSLEMGQKLIKPMGMGKSESKALTAGLSALLGECFSIVQCQTFEDQLEVTRALCLICAAYEADTIITTYTQEMLTEIETSLETSFPVMSYAELIGIDSETGIPLARESSPVEADVIIVLGADALGVEEMNHLLEAAPAEGRLYLLGCPKDLPTLSVGQPFADVIDSNRFKAFHATLWGIGESSKRAAQEAIWSARLEPDLEHFDPSQPLAWMQCDDTYVPAVVVELIQKVSEALDIDPLLDIRVVTPSAGRDSNKVSEAIAAAYGPSSTEARTFQGRKYHPGLPVIVRQPLATSECPPFSVFTPTEVTESVLSLTGADGSKAIVKAEDKIDVFDALVVTPKFIRGRRHEVIILLAASAQAPLINKELLSSALNASKRFVAVVGDLKSLTDDFGSRASSRSRSKLLDWIHNE
ncbi:hypothetical protein LCGC14_0171410 [marine sediment metagenome]|uniref:ATP-dependent RecD2 DNA helicase-like helix-hairpin-helix domain-containing protein n=1 Tax=marine sediment metagenome TaxID=412755 RepID=A0A0F9XAW2_9ZZZZ